MADEKQEKHTESSKQLPYQRSSRSPILHFRATKLTNFKEEKSRKKQIPYEKLDFTIYKPSANMSAFCTSEERLILWIETFYFRYYTGLKENTWLSARWEEQKVANDPSKCEKIVLNISYLEVIRMKA
jgi:hypothetical protein